MYENSLDKPYQILEKKYLIFDFHKATLQAKIYEVRCEFLQLRSCMSKVVPKASKLTQRKKPKTLKIN